MSKYSKISVIGLGYIGLPTAAVFAAHGVKVIGIDVNEDAVNTINQGKIHIVEPGLGDAVKDAVTNSMLTASLTPEKADAFIVAVPTPFKGENHEPDLSYIRSAAKTIAPVLERGNLVILESTSPVGATEEMERWLAEARPDLTFPSEHGDDSDIRVAHCPERVLPGHIMRELIENDRVVGGITAKCAEEAVQLYNTFVEGECVVTTARTAEMAKLTENSFRDVNIAFANELSIICDELDIDVWELIALSNRHPRVNILQPGPGVGGHCIAVDPWFIVSRTPEHANLIRTAREVNDSKPGWVIDKVKVAISDFLQENPNRTTAEVTVACYGLAFKPDIDDLRESPAFSIAKQITELHQGRVLLVEPNIHAKPESMTKGELVSLNSAMNEADVHILLVDHKEFKAITPSQGKLVDSKGIWK